MSARGLIAALMLAVASPAIAQAPADAPLRMTDMRLHDPWIVADEASRTYYLFTRNDAVMSGDRRLGTMVYSSRDLKHWTRPRLAFVLPQGHWANGGAWAPEVHRWKGKWYLFTTFHNETASLGKAGPRAIYRRGTVLAVADRPDGPFTLVHGGEPIVPKAQMTLDGSLYTDPKGKPWIVYAHEWLQMGDGTIEAAPLKDDLSVAGPSRVLFKGSEGPWVGGQKQPEGDTVYVTDGPELYRTKTGTLLMLWSSYAPGGKYVQAQARSRSGGIEGPWEQIGPLVQRDSGHGMLFKAFDGTLMLVLHRPFENALGKLYEMRDDGDRLSVVREATELDGEAYPTHPCRRPGVPAGEGC